MLLTILSMIVNVAYLVILNIAFYTDRAVMPMGGVREWHRSPVARLQIADQSFLFYLQIVLAAVSIISGILLLLGVRRSSMRIIQTVSTIGATVLFVIIMIVTADSNARYA